MLSHCVYFDLKNLNEVTKYHILGSLQNVYDDTIELCDWCQNYSLIINVTVQKTSCKLVTTILVTMEHNQLFYNCLFFSNFRWNEKLTLLFWLSARLTIRQWFSIENRASVWNVCMRSICLVLFVKCLFINRMRQLGAFEWVRTNVFGDVDIV